MRRPTLAIMFPIALIAACDRADPGAGSGDEVNAAATPAVPSENESVVPVQASGKGTSIMRPSVVNEVAPAEPEAPEPIAATIPFGDGGTDLSDEARAAIDRVLADPAFAELGEVVLRGHSDSKGSDKANLSVSQKRAEAVRDYLVAHGVAEARIRIIALGEQRPVAPNANPDGSVFEEGRARNRRVEVEVMPKRAEPGGASTGTADSDGAGAPQD